MPGTSQVAGLCQSFGNVGDEDGAFEARFDGPKGITISDSGVIYVADAGNSRIRVVEDGEVSTLTGTSFGFMDGAPGQAMFNSPQGLLLDPNGESLYVADTNNNRVRIVPLP